MIHWKKIILAVSIFLMAFVLIAVVIILGLELFRKEIRVKTAVSKEMIVKCTKLHETEKHAEKLEYYPKVLMFGFDEYKKAANLYYPDSKEFVSFIGILDDYLIAALKIEDKEIFDQTYEKAKKYFSFNKEDFNLSSAQLKCSSLIAIVQHEDLNEEQLMWLLEAVDKELAEIPGPVNIQAVDNMQYFLIVKEKIYWELGDEEKSEGMFNQYVELFDVLSALEKAEEESRMVTSDITT